MPQEVEPIPVGAEAAYRGRMAHVMLSGFNAIDLRTALQLQAAGVMESDPDQDLAPSVQAALQQQPRPRSPLLVYPGEGGTGRHVTAAAELLGARSPSVRLAALDAILEDSQTFRPPLLTVTVQALRGQRATLAQDEGWQAASVAIMDALQVDWCYRLATVRQCVSIGFDDGVSKYLGAVLRPDSATLAALANEFFGRGISESAPARFNRIIDSSNSIVDALNDYIDQLGYLPLEGDLSATALVKKWLDARGGVMPRFEAFWEWASNHPSSLASYHACRIGIELPDCVDEADRGRLWKAVIEVTRWWALPEDKTAIKAKWDLRSLLTAHFVRHGECAAHFSTVSESFSSLSLWQAEVVAQIFGADDSLDWAVEQMAKPELQRTGWLWSLGRPASTRSLLRFGTLNSRMLWGTALLCAIERQADRLDVGQVPADARDALAEIAMSSLVTGFPPPSGDPGESPFDLAIAPRTFAEKLVAVVSKEYQTALAGAIKLADTIVTPKDLLQALAQTQVTEPEQVRSHRLYVAFRIRLLAYLGELQDEAVWEVVSDSTWRKAVFAEGEPDMLEPVFEALCELLNQRATPWKARFPHLLAETVETLPEGERRSTLFGLTLLACLATDTSSAIERLLSGRMASEFQDDVEQWRKRLRDSTPDAAPWIRGRLRAMLAVLHLD